MECIGNLPGLIVARLAWWDKILKDLGILIPLASSSAVLFHWEFLGNLVTLIKCSPIASSISILPAIDFYMDKH